MSEPAKKLVLLDSHALIHRAYHALPDFATKDGEPTGALYGLSTMLLKLITDFEPDYIVACYDRAEKTYRHETYADYKGTRKKLDEPLIRQLNTSKEIFEALDIPIYDKAGFEADDILGTIVDQMKSVDGHLRHVDDAHQHTEIIIASGDMDTLQLVDGDRVKVFTLKKGIKDTVIYNEKAVLTRFGFGPLLIPDYKGLRGDPSDNIPGIAGIGEKTATILITTFGILEDMYNTLEKKGQEPFKKAGITDRIFNLLKEGKEDAFFSKMLATIRRDAPIEFKLPEKIFRDSVDVEKADRLFRKYEFRTLGIKLKDVMEKNKNGKGNGKGKNKIIGELSYNDEEIKGGEVEGYDAMKNKDIVEDDHQISRETGILISVVDSSATNPQTKDLLEVAGTKDEKKAIEFLNKKIKEDGLEKVLKLENDLLPVLEKAEKIGVKIDKKYLKDLSKKYHKRLDTIEKDIYEHAGAKFNIASPKQLGEILFDKLNLTAKGMKKTAGGARSTKESELLKLKDIHPIISLILEHRELSKLLSTYIDSIPELVSKEDGRLHTYFLQMGAATGRMSSINPNLQNIPIKSELGRAIRNAFIADEGFTFGSFDYSQIELRIAAFLSGDEKLINIFKEGVDIHSAVSSQVFNVPLSEVTKEMRRKAKVINFGILYGMGVTALRQNLQSNGDVVSKEEAQKFLDEYFSTYSRLAEWLEEIKEETKKNGFITTLFGRRRYLPDIKSHLPFLRAAAERVAVNVPIQGTEADIIKLAMINIDTWIKKEKLENKVRLLIQVHDELDFEIHQSVKEKVFPKIKEIMESVLSLKETKGVPIVVEGECGKSWGELEIL